MNRAYFKSPHWDKNYKIIHNYDFKPNLVINFYNGYLTMSGGDFRFYYTPYAKEKKIRFSRKSLYTETRFKRFLKVK